MFGPRSCRRAALTGVFACGVLLLGACGDDSDSDSDDEASEAGDEGSSGDLGTLCSDAESVMADTQSSLQATGELGTEQLEGIRDMFQGMQELDAPDDLAEDWDLYFGSGAEYYGNLASESDGAAEELDNLEDLDESELEDMAADQEELLGAMADPEVVTAGTTVGEFLDENCDLAL